MRNRRQILRRGVLTLLAASLPLASAAQDQKKSWNFDAEKTGAIAAGFTSDSTFMGAGNIGLWTKADAQTHFDDLTVSGN